MCLLKNDLVELHFGSPVFFVSVEAFQDVFGKQGAGVVGQPSVADYEWEVFLDHGDCDTVDGLGTEQLYHIVYKGGFAGLFYVNDAFGRVEPCGKEGLPNPRIEKCITVVKVVGRRWCG